ncbi:MAG: MMPL family transporter [Kineosporiaceae bacterium]|nr:MMPL family transporter [Kineosporiaceae bacterium]
MTTTFTTVSGESGSSRSTPPSRLARVIIGRARWVLAASLLAVVLAGALGAGAIGKLLGGGFEDPASESSRANRVLEQSFGQRPANLVLLVTAPDGVGVDDATVAAVGRDVARRLDAVGDVEVLASYWGAPPAVAAGLRSTDGHRAMVVAHVEGSEDAVLDRARPLQEQFTGPTPLPGGGTVQVQTGGLAQASLDINSQVATDLARAELIAIPLTVVMLIVVFGSVVSGLLPLLVGGIAILATFAVLSGLAEFTSVSIFALNLTTALGLGLGIDYSLLVVNRFREELAAGHAVPDAVAITVRTAGRTVAFSGATIAVALAALLVFPLYFLRSFAYAGIAVVSIAALAATVTLPALLTVLGRRVNALPVGRRRDLTVGGGAFWHRLAQFVMRRPVASGLPVIVLLLTLGLPFLGISFSVPDDRAIPAQVSQGRQVGDILRTEFGGQDDVAVFAVLPQATPGQASAFADRLAAVPNVARAHAEGRVVKATLAVDPFGAGGERAVRDIRAVAAADADLGEVSVGGPTAALVDTKTTIGHRLPWAGLLIGLTTFVLLFAFTGSVVLPLKALVLNAFTIVAVLGSMVWVFQDGHLADLLGFTPMPLTITMPLLMFAVAFGLSMDYEVFLLGRITELHQGGADTAEAVAGGLARTGRIISTAAVLLSITLFAFVSSKVSFIQMFGLGTGLAIVLDATLVRGVLMPSIMRLMGSVNWWAPAPLRRLHARYGLREGGL